MTRAIKNFLDDIEKEARARGISPSMLLRVSVNAKGTAWSEWNAGTCLPTYRTADRFYEWCEQNPPKSNEAA